VAQPDVTEIGANGQREGAADSNSPRHHCAVGIARKENIRATHTTCGHTFPPAPAPCGRRHRLKDANPLRPPTSPQPR
jgi:hypothetical protein